MGRIHRHLQRDRTVTPFVMVASPFAAFGSRMIVFVDIGRGDGSRPDAGGKIQTVDECPEPGSKPDHHPTAHGGKSGARSCEIEMAVFIEVADGHRKGIVTCVLIGTTRLESALSVPHENSNFAIRASEKVIRRSAPSPSSSCSEPEAVGSRR